MKDQDRDEAIGRLLTSMQQHGHADASACLDAESLAAWVENQLAPAQRSAAETHVASCPRCQSMLAAMARTATAGDTLASGEQRSRSWVFRSAPWMAALGGAAAVALLVVANQPRTEQAAAVPEPVSQDSQARDEEAKKAPVDQLHTLKDAPTAPPASSPPARSRQDARVPPPLAKQREARQEAAANTVAPQEKAAPPLARNERDVRTADAAAAAKPDVPAAPAAPGQAGAAPPRVTPIGERAQESERFAAARQVAALDAVAAPVFIQSPDTNIRWRIMGGTVVQHSADAGATWTTQDVKVEAPLVAGSAPAPGVCWLAGRQGTVFVTTDGRTWQRVTPPAAIDLIGVVAASADDATVAAADGRSFTTSDRGRTWR